MTTPLDLEELKRLVAGARLPLKHERTEYASMITDGRGRTLLGVSRSYMEHVGDCEAHLDLFVGASNALPDLIARVERAEKALKAATERVEEIIERADTKAEDAGSDTEERAYYEGRMEAAIAISNTLTGDTPNV